MNQCLSEDEEEWKRMNAAIVEFKIQKIKKLIKWINKYCGIN